MGTLNQLIWLPIQIVSDKTFHRPQAFCDLDLIFAVFALSQRYYVLPRVARLLNISYSATTLAHPKGIETSAVYVYVSGTNIVQFFVIQAVKFAQLGNEMYGLRS